jgi:hypothetical protein
MGAKRSGTTLPTTIPFELFWKYLQAHPNCIVRAGTPDATLYDDEDYHWHFTSEPDGTLIAEVIRGKKLVGDVAIVPTEISYVQVEPDEHDEFRFDLIHEAERDRVVTHYFVLSHAYDAEEVVTPGKWKH